MKLMVLDGNSILNRAFYGVRPLNTKDGTPTNAVYGFLNILLKLLEDEKPDGLCVAFDLKAPTFRHKMYDGYKAQRKPMPEELAIQMPIIKDVLSAMNIPRLELEGYEADDIIGTVAKICHNEGSECIIVTGDKDSFQLIDDTTSVLHVKSRMGRTETKTYTPDAFREEYGFEPPLMVDFKALMGDPSDNIPGVAGVGEKTALDLVRRYGEIKSIYADVDALEVTPSVKKKLTAGKDSAQMSYTLAEIFRTVPVDFKPQDAVRRPVDNDKLFGLFQVLEFNKLTQRLELTPPESHSHKSQETKFVDWEICADFDAEEALSKASVAEFVAVRITPAFDAIAVAFDEKIYYFNGTDDALKALFSNKVKKVGHDIKDIMKNLTTMGFATDGWVFDTALAAYLLNATENNYALPQLAEEYLGIAPTEHEEEAQLSLLSNDEFQRELCREAQILCLLKTELEARLNEFNLIELYTKIELPMCSVLCDMERSGFLVDRNALSEFGKMLFAEMESLEKQIYSLAGESFNINSPKQLGVILFEKLMLPAPKKTKTGWSTSADVLEKLRGKHEIIGLILNYRQLSKLYSTYAQGLIRFIGADGRIHTTFQMTVTATGRLSSTEPNLQNIPIRRELGGEIRKMFVAPEGRVLVDADYSQIELRLLAHISQDKTMTEAFKSDMDIHTVTASQVFGTPANEVTAIQRSRAKAVNFGIVYGISKFSLSQDIGVSVAEAGRYMDSYLENYHGVREYMTSIVEKAKADGYVTTLFGRRRALPELYSSNHNIRSFGERVALNMPVQGTAADIMKLAMINVWKRLNAEKLDAKLILQVHDELIVECAESEADKVSMVLREEMENAANLSVPLTVDVNRGRSWYDAK
ncbi:MAG: DNA polymerase I [Ruminococcaceae bacterium]|nr:DNA polymerase I [Oscillospiraceae bacterium]